MALEDLLHWGSLSACRRKRHLPKAQMGYTQKEHRAMSKKQKDTSWDLPAGIRTTGLNNLTLAMGQRSHEVVERLNSDPDFATAAGCELIGLFDCNPSKKVRPTMEDVKQIMGGRCFLVEEAAEILGLQHREMASIPKLTGRQIEKLIACLGSSCPIMRNRPAAETHILFPQPSTISGATFSVRWVLDNAKEKLGIKINTGDILVPDAFYNKVRKVQWLLMFWGPNGESAAPSDSDIKTLLDKCVYREPDLAEYTLALAYLKARDVNIGCLGIRDVLSSARLFIGLRAHRTWDGSLNVCLEKGGQPAAIRKVPLK